MARRSRIGRLRAAIGWNAPGEPAGSISAILAGGASVAVTWDLASDRLTLESPHGAAVVTGADFADLVDAQGDTDRRDMILHAVQDEPGSAPFRGRYPLWLSRNRLVTVEETGRCFLKADGHPFRAESMLRLEDNAAPAQTGSLSGDRFAALAAIAEAASRAGRSNRAGTLVVGTIEPGHADPEGGFARAARLARPLLRRDDRLMPLGENSFVLLLPSCPSEEAPAALARLKHLLRDGCSGERPFRLAAGDLTAGALDPGQALRAIERELRPAHIAADLETDSAAIVLDALNSRSLDLLLRPVADATNRQATFHIAVAALPSQAGPRPAPEIRQAAEQAGLSLLLESRLLEFVADILMANPGLRVALPVAASTLANREWLTIVAAHIGARPGIGPRLLIETSVRGLSRYRTIGGRLAALKALGVGTVLRGVGIGPAAISERALRTLSVDILAIDGRLAQSFRRSPEDGEKVRRLVEQAQRLGGVTCAEWVDDPSLARALALAGIDYLEGPLFPAVSPMAGRQRLAARG
jgi:EAL domain-containing protein (putative c-di-GMP-specific phosphodiesterase class I)